MPVKSLAPMINLPPDILEAFDQGQATGVPEAAPPQHIEIITMLISPVAQCGHKCRELRRHGHKNVGGPPPAFGGVSSQEFRSQE
jgi:hypothetical protein